MTPLVRAWHAHCTALEAEGIPFDRTREALTYLGFPADACPGDVIVRLWGERDDLLRALGRAVHRGPMSEEAKAAREPLRPDELIDAQHDRVHRDLGVGRAARAWRIP